MGKRLVIIGIVAACAVPAALFAQPMTEDGVSRAVDGAILHRRLPGAGSADRPGAGPSTGAPPAETPTFVYDPSTGGSGLPSDLMRDGRPLPKPSAAAPPADDEPVHTAGGLAPSRPTDPDPAAPPAVAPAPDAPVDPLAAPQPRLDPDAAVADAGPDALSVPVPGDPSDDPDGGTAGEPTGPSPDSPEADAGATGPAGDDASGPTPDGGASGDEPFSDPRGGLGSEARPDRRTEREGTLHYSEVFDPSIVPFKRNRSLNAVDKDYTLRVEPGRLEVLRPLGNRLDPGHEVFWGSVLLDGEAGERIPLPSVAPESRILSYEANPAQDVRFERDEAGNFYATPSLAGRLRLVFVMDAPSTYFGRPLPTDATLAAVPAALRPKVPRAIAKEAREVAAAIGVPAGAGYAATLDALVAWFRGFTPGEPPPAETSIYRDIALGKTGVCRHRGHGFVITAQALGIPAHYVFNEAHVFVEVWVPAGAGAAAGWLRIDLGGGAEALDVHGEQGKTLHPGGPDPFSAPPPFEAARAQGQTAGAERVTGLPTPEPTPAPTPAPAPGAAGGDAPGAPTGITRVTPMADLTPTVTTLEAVPAGGAGAGPSGAIVFRGDGVEVRGRVTTQGGEPVAEGTVQLVLLAGPERRAVAQLGVAALDRDGRFRAAVDIPPTQSPGAYELIAEFLGDGVHSPSVSP